MTTKLFAAVIGIASVVIPAGYARAEKEPWQTGLEEKMSASVAMVNPTTKAMTGTTFLIKAAQVPASDLLMNDIGSAPQCWYYEGQIALSDPTAPAKKSGFGSMLKNSAMTGLKAVRTGATAFRPGETVVIRELVVKDATTVRVTVSSAVTRMDHHDQEKLLASQIHFKFPPGYLEKATPDEVWAKMSEVIEPVSGFKKPVSNATPVAVAVAAVSPDQTTGCSLMSLMGLNSEQVMARCGMPNKIEDVGGGSQALTFNGFKIRVTMKKNDTGKFVVAGAESL